jgi:hypothetical protein
MAVTGGPASPGAPPVDTPDSPEDADADAVAEPEFELDDAAPD